MIEVEQIYETVRASENNRNEGNESILNQDNENHYSILEFFATEIKEILINLYMSHTF